MKPRAGGEPWTATLRRWAKVVALLDAIALAVAAGIMLGSGDRSLAGLERSLWICVVVVAAGWLLAIMTAAGFRQPNLLDHGGMIYDEELRYLARPGRFRDIGELTAVAWAVCFSLMVAGGVVGAL